MTAAAAALSAVGLATATPGGSGTPALDTALAAHGGIGTLTMPQISLDQPGGAPAGPGRAYPGLAGGLPVTANGWAILASGRAAAQAVAGRPARYSPTARSGNRAPAGQPDSTSARHASRTRPVRDAQLDRSARNGHHAAPAHRAGRAHRASLRHAGSCASSTLHGWICQAETILEQHGVSRGLLSTSAAYIVVEHESGGNPAAYNGWDSNAAAGHPSEGIVQVIGPTFHAYALPGHHNIWNPVDNMIAGFRYAISRYGSMNNIPGVVAVRQGGSYVGY